MRGARSSRDSRALAREPPQAAGAAAHKRTARRRVSPRERRCVRSSRRLYLLLVYPAGRMIACLGWGSLIWDPRELPVAPPWRDDGPWLPVEFARVSSDQRLTLVIVPGYPAQVRTLWAPLKVRTLEAARQALGERESVPAGHRARDIGAWPADGKLDAVAKGIGHWARDAGVAGVVWTQLPPRFNDVVGRMPTEDEAVEYLRGRAALVRRKAEEYIRRAPSQIRTPYRRRVELELGWTAE